MNGRGFLATGPARKFGLVSLVALIVVGGVSWFYGYNQWTIYQAYQAKIGGLKQNIAEAQQLDRTLTQTAAVRVKVCQFVDAHEETMVSGDYFAWVIREISQLAEAQPVGHVTTQVGHVTQHARKAARQWYVTHLEFTGDYDQIGRFVRELENHFPEAEIRSLTMQATEAPATHRATLDLALLVRPVMETGRALLAQEVEANHEHAN